jgi:hypothetical protein
LIVHDRLTLGDGTLLEDRTDEESGDVGYANHRGYNCQ